MNPCHIKAVYYSHKQQKKDQPEVPASVVLTQGAPKQEWLDNCRGDKTPFFEEPCLDCGKGFIVCSWTKVQSFVSLRGEAAMFLLYQNLGEDSWQPPQGGREMRGGWPPSSSPQPPRPLFSVTITGIQPRLRSIAQDLPECVAYVDECEIATTIIYIHAYMFICVYALYTCI